MKRILLIGLAIIAVLITLVIAAGTLLGTDQRPVPAITSGIASLSLPVSHRSVPLPVTIWYPSPDKTTPILMGQNALFYGHYAQVGATPTPSPLPVVLLSHGSGGNADRLGWIASALAMRGIIVAAVDHPGTTSGDSDPFQTIKIWERPADFRAVLDMLADTPPLGLQPDLDRVGVVGFSLGGQTALALSGVEYSKDAFIDYCNANAGLDDCGWMQNAGVDFATINADLYEASHADTRITTTVAIDPAGGRAAADLGALKTNALLINLGSQGDIPESMRADDLAATSGADYVTISDSWHFSFLADCSALGRIVMWAAGEDPICTDVNGRARASVHGELNQLIGAFLDDALIGQSTGSN